jgi:hypothetical protein
MESVGKTVCEVSVIRSDYAGSADGVESRRQPAEAGTPIRHIDYGGPLG